MAKSKLHVNICLIHKTSFMVIYLQNFKFGCQFYLMFSEASHVLCFIFLVVASGISNEIAHNRVLYFEQSVYLSVYHFGTANPGCLTRARTKILSVRGWG